MKVQIIVEQASDGKFWCYTEQGIGDVGLSALVTLWQQQKLT